MYTSLGVSSHQRQSNSNEPPSLFQSAQQQALLLKQVQKEHTYNPTSITGFSAAPGTVKPLHLIRVVPNPSNPHNFYIHNHSIGQPARGGGVIGSAALRNPSREIPNAVKSQKNYKVNSLGRRYSTQPTAGGIHFYTPQLTKPKVSGLQREEPWISHSQKTGGNPQFVLASTKAKMVSKKEESLRTHHYLDLQDHRLDLKNSKSTSPKKLVKKKNQVSRNK